MRACVQKCKRSRHSASESYCWIFVPTKCEGRLRGSLGSGRGAKREGGYGGDKKGKQLTESRKAALGSWEAILSHGRLPEYACENQSDDATYADNDSATK